MEEPNDSLREPLIDSQVETSIQQKHTFTFANGITRSVSRRDESISCTPEWVRRELRIQLYIAGPMVCVALMQYLLIVVSVMFVGHLGELQLASSSIASSFAGVTGTSCVIGMASALDTLCGQAFGAKQYHMLGIYMQRAIFVLYLVCIPISVVWWNMDSLLVFLGQDPEISDLAGLYARFLVPTVFAVATVQPLLKFLQAQSIVLPMAIFSAITLLLHIPLCWLLIFKLDVGYRGAAIATSTSSWLNVIFLAVYVKYSPTCKKTWTRFSREALNDLPAFFALAIPSTIMICLEYWSFEALVLLSGLLPNPQLETSTLSICLTTLALIYMIPYGVGSAVSTRVSNELGAGRPQAAKGAVLVALAVAFVDGFVMAILLFACRNGLGRLFSNERKVINYVARCLPLLAVMHVMDAVQAVLSGVARGCGWQAWGAYANLGAYYCVGLPTSVVLAFAYHLKGRGLWVGIVLGVTTQTMTLLIMTSITNWQQQAETALMRVYSSAAATLPIDANHAHTDDIPALLLRKDDRDDHEEFLLSS